MAMFDGRASDLFLDEGRQGQAAFVFLALSFSYAFRTMSRMN
jgi:hypothetical protein